MEKFVKLFGFRPARETERYIEYRGLPDIDALAMRAVRILQENEIRYTSIEKDVRLRGFRVYF